MRGPSGAYSGETPDRLRSLRSTALVPVLATLLVLLVASPALAQDRVRVLYAPTASLAEDPETERFAAIIDEAIRRELLLLDLELLPAAASAVPIEQADSAGARLVFESSALATGRELVMTFRAVDVESRRLVDAAFVPTIVGVTVLNRIDEAVGEFADSLAEFLANPGETAAIAPFALAVTVAASPDGTTISLPSGEVVGSVEDGSLDFPFTPYPVGARLLLTKEREGFHPDEEAIELASPVNTFTLDPLWKLTRWAVDLHSTTGQIVGLGLGGRYYIDPDTWFVGVDGYYFSQLPVLDSLDPVAHVDLGARTGRYVLLGYRSPFRFGLGVGAGVILTRIRGAERQLFTDVYLNLASIRVELNTRSWIFYARTDAKVALGIGNNLLGGRFLDVRYGGTSSGPAVTVGVGRKL